jgi:hypothetical protein
MHSEAVRLMKEYHQARLKTLAEAHATRMSFERKKCEAEKAARRENNESLQEIAELLRAEDVKRRQFEKSLALFEVEASRRQVFDRAVEQHKKFPSQKKEELIKLLKDNYKCQDGDPLSKKIEAAFNGASESRA